ncbi:hypothetical protein JXA32_11390 [Candidatus Sumerlaeota bacterium]|nr:hypothetical protein [Candidatus Sumerlaeota bacterium]
MAGILASITSAWPELSGGRSQETPQSASQNSTSSSNPASLTPDNAALAANDADVVELSGLTPDAVNAQINELYNVLNSARQTPSSQSQPAAIADAENASAQAAGFSWQSLLGNWRESSGGSLDSLFNDLQVMADELRQYDHEQMDRLEILLRTLAKLDPDNAHTILNRMRAAIGRTLDLMRSYSSAQAAPAAIPEQTSQNEQAQASFVHFSLDLEMEFTEEIESVVAELRDNGVEVQTARIRSSSSISIHVEFTGVQVQQSDPLVLDLNGDGVNLSSYENGAAFDINGDGAIDRTAFVQGDDALLALDRDGNGRIDDGGELFGDQHGAVNGFEELARYDDNADGMIDQQDAIFSLLRLLHDRNGDGTVAGDELSTLEEQGITAIRLDYQSGSKDDGQGNTLAEEAVFQRADGSQGAVVDAWLGYQS